MSYSIIISVKAENDIDRLEKSGDKGALKKLLSMLDELARHPTSGTGKPERLKNYTIPTYSRRISGKHRLVTRFMMKKSSLFCSLPTDIIPTNNYRLTTSCELNF